MGWMQDLWNTFFGALATPFAAADNYLLGFIPPALEYSPTLGTGAVQQVWTIVFSVFLASLGITVVGIGLLYMLSASAEKRLQLKHLWMKLTYALVLGASSILIGNFAIDLANQLTLAILGNVNVSIFGQGYWSNSINALGPGCFIVYIIALIFIVMVLIENGVRILMIFFAGALLPWGFLLWSFPTLQSYGTKIIRMFFEWTFVSVFMAVVLAITFLILGGNGTGNDVLDMFLVLGGLGLVAAMPKVMTETGAAVSDVGMGVLGGVGAAQGGMLGGFSGAGGAMGGAAGAAGPVGMAAKGVTSAAGALTSKVGGALGSGGGSGGGGGGGGMMASLGRAGWMMAYNPIGGAGALGGMVAGGMIKAGGRAISRGARGVSGVLRRHGAVKAATGAGMAVSHAKAIAGGQFSPSGAKGKSIPLPGGGFAGKDSPQGRQLLGMEKGLQGQQGAGVYRASVATRQRVHSLGQRLRKENALEYHAIRQRVSGTSAGPKSSSSAKSEVPS